MEQRFECEKHIKAVRSWRIYEKNIGDTNLDHINIIKIFHVVICLRRIQACVKLPDLFWAI